MYRKIFWFLLFWTLLSIFIYFSGYDILGSVMMVLAIDIIALGFVIELGKKRYFKEISAEINTRIENIERICQSISESFGGDLTLQKVDEKINKQKDDISYLLDKLSRKMLSLEEKINKFGYSLAEHIEEKTREDNSFSIGETIYMEKDDENV